MPIILEGDDCGSGVVQSYLVDVKSEEHAGIISRRGGRCRSCCLENGEGTCLFWCGSGACGVGETWSGSERGSQVTDLS